MLNSSFALIIATVIATLVLQKLTRRVLQTLERISSIEISFLVRFK
jgi:hypothetical protein